MNKMKDRIAGIILTLLSLLLTVGVKTLFSACGAKDDGSFMSCHYAEQAVFGMGIALTVISVCVLISGGSRIGTGCAVALIPAGAVTLFTPGVLINLCMMPNMHCHTVMHPAVSVICGLIIAAAAVHVFLSLRKRGERK
ncbi:MAG: DUF4418 family protein [Ruminiclostridium sp.]|nr:DUF4418 family protein [Ruminiclostridium sp.]